MGGLIAGATYAFIVPAVRDFQASRTASSSKIGIIQGLRGILGDHPLQEPTLPIASTSSDGSSSDSSNINSDEFAIFDSTSTISVKKSATSTKPRTSRPVPPPPNPVVPPPIPEPVPIPEPPTPPPGFNVSQLSPYYGKVRIGNFSYSQDPYTPSSLSLYGDGAIEKPIAITGWKIRGNRGGDIVIPGAVSDFAAVGVMKNGPIQVVSNTVINFWNDRSPIEKNFRLNKCTGYLNATAVFNQSIPNECPSPVDSNLLVRFSGACQNFINSLGTCAVPTPEEVNIMSVYDNGGCAALLQKFGYVNCYATHYNDTDFFGNEWRVWLAQAIMFDSLHDQLLLLDTNNLLVDRMVY